MLKKLLVKLISKLYPHKLRVGDQAVISGQTRVYEIQAVMYRTDLTPIYILMDENGGINEEAVEYVERYRGLENISKVY